MNKIQITNITNAINKYGYALITNKNKIEYLKVLDRAEKEINEKFKSAWFPESIVSLEKQQEKLIKLKNGVGLSD